MIRASVNFIRQPIPLLGVLGAVFIGTGVLLRLYNFTGPELWIDEYGTWWVVSPHDWGEVTRRAVQIQGQSPFYYFFVKLSADVLGPSVLSLRLPSILFGIGIVGLAYPLGLRIFHDHHAALFTLAAFALNERMIFYSQEARPYSLALFCALVSFLFYLSLLKRDTLSLRLGYVLATAAAYYAHYLFGFIVVIQIVHLCSIREWAQSRVKAWALTFFALVLVVLPGIPQLFNLFARRESLNWLPPPELFAPLRLVVEFLNPGVFSATAFVVLVLGTAVVGTQGLPREAKLGLILSWLLVPIVVFGVISTLSGTSLLSSRYLLFTSPAAILVTAWLMAVVRRPDFLRWIPLIVFVTATVLWNLLPHVQVSGTFARWFNQDWAKAAQDLERSARPDDMILYRTGFVEADLLPLPDPDPTLVSFLQWPLLAHLSSAPRQMIGLPFRDNAATAPYIASVVNQTSGSSRVWVVGLGELAAEVAQRVLRDRHFQLKKRSTYGHVQVILLEQTER